jgi:hypothetical protein
LFQSDSSFPDHKTTAVARRHTLATKEELQAIRCEKTSRGQKGRGQYIDFKRREVTGSNL